MAQAGTTNTDNRNAWVIAALESLPGGTRLLDAGAGMQPYRRYCDRLEYVAQDFAAYDGQGDGVGLHKGEEWNYEGLDIVSDITAIPEPEASFGAILCTEVLEHIPDPLAALREFARLLNDGGSLIVTVPFCSFTHYAPYHYCTGFSRYFFETHLPALGLTIEELSFNGGYFDFFAQELRRLPRVAEHYSRGRLSRAERRAADRLLEALDRLITDDRGSSELLSFGIHVRARRRHAAAHAA